MAKPPPNLDPTRSPKWPYPRSRAEGPLGLPHPRRYLDGDRTRCPDCGAVTRDPTVLGTLPCRGSQSWGDHPIDPDEVDTVTVNEPIPQSIGFTWFDPSVQICWIWAKDSAGDGGWYDVETDKPRSSFFPGQLELPLFQRYLELHKRATSMARSMTTPSDEPEAVTFAIELMKTTLIRDLKDKRTTALEVASVAVVPAAFGAGVTVLVTVPARKVLRG